MTRLHLSCDCGERGFAHPDDLALLPLVDQVSIAVGGHAGDAATASDLAARAAAIGVAVALHPSYPDRAGFGRSSMRMRWSDLRRALDVQRALLPEASTCKLHGALYHDADRDEALARAIASWCAGAGIAALVAPPAGAQEAAARAAGLDVVREGFADRTYVMTAAGPALAPRGSPGAVIADPAVALAQVEAVVERGLLPVGGSSHPFACDTWCLHGDNPAAIGIARALRRRWP